MSRFNQRLYSLVETIFLRHPWAQLALVLVVIVFISLLGGLVVFVGSGDFRSFGAAVWWAFLRLTDPGYLGDDQGTLVRFVSTILTMAGYVVFLGALVAIMTTWLSRALHLLASGLSPILEDDHFLLVGNNERIVPLIEELVRSGGRLEESDWHPNIVLLTEDFEPAMLPELQGRLQPEVRDRCELQWRRGNPLEAESLERVGSWRARAILLLADDRLHPALSDVTLSKILLSLKAQAPPELKSPPQVVVDLQRGVNKALVESVGWVGRTEAVVSIEFLGRLLWQAVRFPGLSHVYNHLLTDTFGDGLLLASPERHGWLGLSLRQAIKNTRDAIPIGVLRGDSLKLLNLDQLLEKGDQVVLVGCSTRGKDPGVAFTRQREAPQQRRLLVVGQSRHLLFLVEQLCLEGAHCEVVVAARRNDPTVWSRLEELAHQSGCLQLQFHRVAPEDPRSLVAISPESFHHVLVLADSDTADPLVADAQTVMQALWLGRRFQEQKCSTHLVAELNDEDNRPLLQALVEDVFLTQEMASHLLAQVAIRPGLALIFEELFTVGGAEIVLGRAEGPTRSFEETQAELLSRGALALGVWDEGGLDLGPAPDSEVDPGDLLVVVEPE